MHAERKWFYWQKFHILKSCSHKYHNEKKSCPEFRFKLIQLWVLGQIQDRNRNLDMGSEWKINFGWWGRKSGELWKLIWLVGGMFVQSLVHSIGRFQIGFVATHWFSVQKQVEKFRSYSSFLAFFFFLTDTPAALRVSIKLLTIFVNLLTKSLIAFSRSSVMLLTIDLIIGSSIIATCMMVETRSGKLGNCASTCCLGRIVVTSRTRTNPALEFMSRWCLSRYQETSGLRNRFQSQRLPVRSIRSETVKWHIGRILRQRKQIMTYEKERIFFVFFNLHLDTTFR